MSSCRDVCYAPRPQTSATDQRQQSRKWPRVALVVSPEQDHSPELLSQGQGSSVVRGVWFSAATKAPGRLGRCITARAEPAVRWTTDVNAGTALTQVPPTRAKR